MPAAKGGLNMDVFKSLMKDHFNEFWIEPTVQDLNDLFNSEFNKKSSCFDKKWKMT